MHSFLKERVIAAAATNVDKTSVRQLVRLVVNAENKDEIIEEAITVACKVDNSMFVELIEEYKFDISGSYALSWAASHAYENTLRAVRKAGAPYHCKPITSSPLNHAVCKSKYENINLLLEWFFTGPGRVAPGMQEDLAEALKLAKMMNDARAVSILEKYIF